MFFLVLGLLVFFRTLSKTEELSSKAIDFGGKQYLRRGKKAMMLRWAKVSDGKGDHCDSEEMAMGFNVLSGDEIVKSKRLIVRPRIKVWMARAVTTVVLWTCVVQLMAIGELWGPRLLKAMPYCFSHPESQTVAKAYVPAKVVLPPKRIYKNNGYLMVSCNGGLNQMRAAICDMVAIARHLNVTLIVPELDKSSFWADPSEFQDIFDVDNFIGSLRDEVRILKQLPPRLKRRVELGLYYSLSPVSWSNITYYEKQILPLLLKHKVVHLNRTDARLANNGLPIEIQRLRCRVNFNALRYEMDMLAFSGCTHGCDYKEVEELTRMRYAYPWWKEKVINSELKRQNGLCPLTPEETTLILTTLGIDQSIQIYIAAGEIYGGEKRMAGLQTVFPNLVRKETLLEPSDLMYFQNHSSQMAALDYLVSLESDIFFPTYDGNMAKLVEGHRRFLGFKKTILLDRKHLVHLIDQYTKGSLSWEQLSIMVKKTHANRMGRPKRRVVIPKKPKEEDYFYSNPHECLELQDELFGNTLL
ncbi:hypothetical protein Fmac_016592 [Flemingia macrophylla]|uniref:O-fucosyltransferase family protein n=1 Tax=Flemingia macrophylla TaxID=520843 RepID=A0ABD1MHU9_9FABA